MNKTFVKAPRDKNTWALGSNSMSWDPIKCLMSLVTQNIDATNLRVKSVNYYFTDVNLACGRRVIHFVHYAARLCAR